MKLDSNQEAIKQRKPLREKLKKIMDPILASRITPYIRQRYPDVCGPDVDDGRLCTCTHPLAALCSCAFSVLACARACACVCVRVRVGVGVGVCVYCLCLMNDGGATLDVC